MSHGTLYDHPDLYDLVMGANPAAEAFYIQEAHQRGTSVLELTCGSGRFSIPMAKSGLNVVGGDLSSAMLERARAKADAAGVGKYVLDLAGILCHRPPRRPTKNQRASLRSR